ncbi:Hypothetical protein NTJ_13072 [Nesidiocoris tenuis]|uniref:Lipid-binding serum glycoprotein N-terminal domain-containing protein n=1 Tax=Nesidiocoris tenuis TaxID=355587 RepID=A0ABN7B786_9HEMI|nr:Hypothetical protein NTJ_13072 [Nesidiocoris tenuis]
MEKSRVLLFFGLFAASACRLVTGDPKCVSYDEKIQANIFAPLKEQIAKDNSSYYNLGNYETEFPFGVSLTTIGGRIGDLSNFGLYYKNGDTSTPASQMCDDSTASETVKTLSATFTLNQLQAVFDRLSVTLPVLPTIGDSKTTIQYQDEGIFAKVTIRQSQDKQCTATLNSVQILGVGDAKVEFDSGLINKIYAYAFSIGWSTIKSLLESYGAVDSANTLLNEYGSKLLSGQSQVLCALLPLM